MAVGKGKSFVAVWSAGLEQLQSKTLAPLTAIAGPDPAVKERLIEAVVSRARGAVETFVARPGENDASAAQRLIDTWTTATLFGGRQLIVVRDAGKLLGGPRAALLGKLLEGPEPPHRLLATLESLDGRTKFAKTIRAAGGLISLPPLRDSPPPWHDGGPYLQTDLNEWLVAEATLQGLNCDLRAANELSQRIGSEPGRLIQTLGTLARLLPEGGRLDPAFIAQHVRHTSVRLLGLWEDAVVAGDPAEAVQLSDRMQREGMNDPFGRLVTGGMAGEVILRTFLSRLTKVLEAHEGLDDKALGALTAKPWERSAAASATLDEVLGRAGGGRVFLERDLRRMAPAPAAQAFDVALGALRRLRDGRGASLHATTVRLAQAFVRKSPSLSAPR